MTRPETEAEAAARKAAESSSIGIWVLGGFGLLALIITSVTVFHFMRRADAWNGYGQIGDLFGGVLNPVLTFLTFMGVLITIQLQAKELRLAREESRRAADALEDQVKGLGKQNFEAAFFQMLSLQNDLTDSVVHRGEYREVKGRAAFKLFYDELSERIQYYEGIGSTRADACIKAQDEFWIEAHQPMGYYFRFLYNVLRYIHASGEVEALKLVKLLRAQLSDYELMMIMYNAMNHRGFNLRFYLRKYELLDNLPDHVPNSRNDEMILDDMMDSGAINTPDQIS